MLVSPWMPERRLYELLTYLQQCTPHCRKTRKSSRNKMTLQAVGNLHNMQGSEVKGNLTETRQRHQYTKELLIV